MSSSMKSMAGATPRSRKPGYAATSTSARTRQYLHALERQLGIGVGGFRVFEKPVGERAHGGKPLLRLRNAACAFGFVLGARVSCKYPCAPASGVRLSCESAAKSRRNARACSMPAALASFCASSVAFTARASARVPT